MTCWSAQGSIWEGFGTSRASLGRLLGTLGALLVALGRLLDASWTHLGCSWAPLGCQVLSKMGSGSIFHRFWLHFGRAEAGFARALAVFFFAFLDMVLELLPKTPAGIHSLLFVSRLQRGTCAAHPLPPEGMPSVPGTRYKLPNRASKAFLSLKSLALKAYPKVRLEIEAEAGFPPS